jgi:hypothetical protein
MDNLVGNFFDKQRSKENVIKNNARMNELFDPLVQ